MNRRAVAWAALVPLALTLTGCWNYREVETLSIVAGMAVDAGKQGSRYHLTIDIADTSNAGKDKPVETRLIECEGNSISSAIRSVSTRNGMTLYWQNCQVVILGREVAEEGLIPVIDFMLRDSEPRPTMEFFVSAEETAKEILETKTTSMAIKSFELDKIYEQNEQMQPTAQYLRLYEIYNILASSTGSLTLPRISHTPNGDGMTCEISGMALFRKDKLAGSLTQEDSHSMMYLMDRVKGGTINVKASTGNVIASLGIIKSKTSVESIVENGAVRFSVHIKTEATINELDQQTNVITEELIEGFTAAAQMQLKGDLERALAMEREQFGLDIFGFGETLHKTSPQDWNRLRDKWEEVYRAAPVEISCELLIQNNGGIIEPPRAGG